MFALPDRIDNQFIKVWHPRYDETESDEPEYRRLVAQVKVEMGDLHSLTRQTFTDILNWKASRVKGLIDWLNFDRYSDAIRRCHEASGMRNMSLLVSLHGIGPPVASTFLHFIYPATFPIFDVRTVEVLKYFGHIEHTSTVIRQYPAFMAAILSLRVRFPTWDLRDIDRSLFAFHKQNPELFGTLSKLRHQQNQSEERLHHINDEGLTMTQSGTNLLNQPPRETYSVGSGEPGDTTGIVKAKIRGLGQYYQNGHERFEIHIAKNQVSQLGHSIGLPTAVQLQIGPTIFSGELRSTADCKYLWISAKIIGPNGKRAMLVDALSGSGFVKNQSVDLEITPGLFRIVPSSVS